MLFALLKTETVNVCTVRVRRVCGKRAGVSCRPDYVPPKALSRSGIRRRRAACGGAPDRGLNYFFNLHAFKISYLISFVMKLSKLFQISDTYFTVL